MSPRSPARRTLLGGLLVMLCTMRTGARHDDWSREVYPAEELTSGIEVGPADTVWGHLARVHFKTSRRQFAASTGAVYITFYGTRSTSELHFLQEGFVSGKLDVADLRLRREIGKLERVKLQTNSTDGWLLADLWVDIGPTTYYFETTNRFLDYPDSALADRDWDGGAHGSAFTADPYGSLAELYEPQAPTKATSGTSQVSEVRSLLRYPSPTRRGAGGATGLARGFECMQQYTHGGRTPLLFPWRAFPHSD